MAVLIVVEQHADQLATLWMVRNSLRAAPHVGLRQLARFDERIAAHHDGCIVGGPDAVRILTAQLADPSAGPVFAAALVGLQLGNRETLARCLKLAEASSPARLGMASALGWVEPVQLRGIVKGLLDAPSGPHRCLGLAACRMHRVDPGPALAGAFSDADGDVRTEAVRTAGALGRDDLAPALPRVEEISPFWRAWSAVLLGHRSRALDALKDEAAAPGDHRDRAFRLACQAMSKTAAHEFLRTLAPDPSQLRWLIQGSGIVGDPAYVPWLMEHMADDKLSRLAGEAFTLITGADWTAEKLEREIPVTVESGPNSDPDDPNVDTDPDDNLPWPDVPKIENWWAANSGRFQNGARYFMGQPVTREHCIDVLKNGYQRQRILAAHYLCLLDPGTPLFNTSAPAWRQQRLLAQM